MERYVPFFANELTLGGNGKMIKLSKIIISVVLSAFASLVVLSFFVTDRCLDRGGIVHDAWLACEVAPSKFISWVEIAGIRVLGISIIVCAVSLMILFRLFSVASQNGTNDSDAT